MKGLLLGVCVLFLVGCQEEGITAVHLDEYRQICIDGVVYFEVSARFHSNYNLTAKFNVDGSVATCLDEESMIEWGEDLAFYEKNN